MRNLKEKSKITEKCRKILFKIPPKKCKKFQKSGNDIMARKTKMQKKIVKMERILMQEKK